jgi:plastocyanin
MRRGTLTRGVVAIALTACTLFASAHTAEAVTVGVRGLFNGTRFVWSPKAREITRGVTVRWRAVDGTHNVKSIGANWSYFRRLPNGSAVSRTFNRRGRFRYFCTIHGNVVNGVCSGMCGRIVVS